jgi:hypothetical protein
VAGTSEIKTYRPDNRWSFQCPIFGSTTEIRVCLHLRDLLWSGKRQEVRRGCQACMHDSKCPMVNLVRRIRDTKDEPGYFSLEPKQGALLASDVDRIRKIIVTEETMKRFDVPENERQAILSTNGWNAKLHGKVEIDGKLSDLPGLEEKIASHKPRKRAEAPAPAKTDDVIEAASTGDMSAAVNKAMEDAA